MTKSELVKELAQEKNISLKDSESIIDIFIEEITLSLKRGDRVELRGFGSFAARHRKARKGRNPKTGESIEIKDKIIPYYRMGKDLYNRLNK